MIDSGIKNPKNGGIEKCLGILSDKQEKGIEQEVKFDQSFGELRFVEN